MYAEIPKGRNYSDAKANRVWGFDKFVLAHGDLIETDAKKRSLSVWEKPLRES